MALVGPKGVGREELLLAIGLAGLAIGSHQVWPPAAWLVPSAVITWIALPSRTPLVSRPPAAEPPARRER